MNIKNKLKNKKGFTLAELILTVLIIIILFGVGFLALFQIKKDIEQKRLDSLAQVIFTTSQNQIQTMKAAGQDEKFNPDETGSYAYPIVTTPGQKAVFYYVTSADRDKGVAADILPADSIDSQIRDYNWAIEYNPEIGYVYAVFYWEKDEAGPYDTTTFDPLRDFETRRKDALVGYYGGTTIEQSDTEKLSPTIEIHNGEKLTATLFCENRNFSDTLTFTVTITDQSG
ncbi:MAG: hypothetical protein HUJ75_06920, partial [Parasporobacterium sp.]|nr:hypothetical protein [Parasporobacterium sp.]